jgi:uncharacterized protein (DUF305 family)
MATLPRRALDRAVTVLAALALAGVTLAGCGSETGPAARDAAPSGQNEADVAFAAEMVPHHEQGLHLATMASWHDGTPAFTELTDRIAEEQQADIDQMGAWLTAWEEQAAYGPGPTMGHGTMMQRSTAGTMRGLVRTRMGPWALDDTDLDRLAGSWPPDFESHWLRMMITHHQGAISMARHEIAQGEYPPAIALAEDIVTTQQAEIEQMRAMLRG